MCNAVILLMEYNELLLGFLLNPGFSKGCIQNLRVLLLSNVVIKIINRRIVVKIPSPSYCNIRKNQYPEHNLKALLFVEILYITI